MPLYEYECTKCNHVFEKLQSVKTPNLTLCPTCRNLARRKISVFAAHYKGSGFHTTDYPTGT